MSSWNAYGLDVEALRAFEALYVEGSVTRAAGRLGRTQSAVSKQLGRLREVFGDPLFVYAQQRMQPTARADAMQPRVQALLSAFGELLDDAAFDPGRLEQRFVLSTTDEVECLLAGPLLARLLGPAPRASLSFSPLRPDYSEDELSEGRVHAVISVNWTAPPRLKQRLLFSDRFVCVMRAGHPLQRRKWSPTLYAGANHLVVAPLAQQRGPVDAHLAKLGMRRHVKVTLPHFLRAGDLLAQSDLVCLMPRRAADKLPELDQLVLRAPPFELPAIDYFMFWHQRYDAQPAQRFLRAQIVAAVAAS